MKSIQKITTIINEDQILSTNLEAVNLKARRLMLKLIQVGINAANPRTAIRNTISFSRNIIHFKDGNRIELSPNAKLIIIGAGKATGLMAEEIEDIFEDRITAGLVNIPEQITEKLINLKIIKSNYAGHPYVNDGSINGAKMILKIVDGLQSDDIVICLISGGGSALLELRLEGISLPDLEILFNLLTSSGATIHELNTVRKHLSQIKGGKLAQKIQPAKVISLIISDVINDDLDTIASGPTAPDESTWNDVFDIIEKYRLKDDIPRSILDTINKGLSGEIEETYKKDNVFFSNVLNKIIASNQISCKAIESEVEQLGLKPRIITTNISGEAKVIGKSIFEQIKKETQDSVLIAGGETIVKIKGSGLGGRNQELVLAAGECFNEEKGILITSFGTDGKDGPTDAAGAFIDNQIIKKGIELNLHITEFLENNDSYNFFQKTKGLIKTGLTGTNVMDIIIALKLSYK